VALALGVTHLGTRMPGRKSARKNKKKRSSYNPQREEIDDADAEFGVPALDNDGESTKSIFRHPPLWDRMFSEIIASKKFPFKTKSDVIRYFCRRGFKWLAVQEPQVSCWAQNELNIELLNRESSHAKLAAMFDKLKDQAETAILRGHQGDAIRLLQLSQETIQQMPDTQLRDSYMIRFNEEWGGVLSAAREPMMKRLKAGGGGQGKKRKRKKKKKRGTGD